MHNCLVLVRNLLGQDDVPDVLNDYLQGVNELMADALRALKMGDIS